MRYFIYNFKNTWDRVKLFIKKSMCDNLYDTLPIIFPLWITFKRKIIMFLQQTKWHVSNYSGELWTMKGSILFETFRVLDLTVQRLQSLNPVSLSLWAIGQQEWANNSNVCVFTFYPTYYFISSKLPIFFCFCKITSLTS